MSEARKQALLDKISQVASQVASDDITTAEVNSDIKLYRDVESGNIVIDILVNWIASNKEKPDRMSISYAASNSVIKQPSSEHEEKMCELLERNVANTIKRLEMPNDEETQIATIEYQLINQGKQHLQALMAELAE